MAHYVDKKIGRKYNKKGKHSFPDQEINPRTKGKDYHKQYAEAIYAAWRQNKTAIPYTLTRNIETLRAWSAGTQSTSIFKDEEQRKLSTDNEETETLEFFSHEDKMKAWSNIDWEPISPFIPVKDEIHGRLDEIDYVPNIDCKDPGSGAMKEDMKMSLWTEIKFKDKLQQLRQNANVPEQMQDKDVPTDIKELDLYEQAGGFKLNLESALEKLIQYTFDISDWNSDLKRQFIEDGFTVGWMAAKDYYDKEQRKIKTRVVDLANTTIQYSNRYNYSDSEYAGEIHLYSGSKLQSYGVTKEQIKKAIGASNYNNEQTNLWNAVEQNEFMSDNVDTKEGDFSSNKYPVFEVEWIDTDVSFQKKVKYKKYGDERIEDVPFDKGKEEREEDEDKIAIYRKHRLRRRYSCKWLVGTDIVFDYGADDMEARPLKSKPELTYKFVKVTSSSLVRRAMPFAKEMSRAWYGFQNTLALAQTGGWMINVRLLENVDFGNDEKSSYEQALELMRKARVFLYSDAPLQRGGKYEGGGVTPITPLPSILAQQIQDDIMKWDFATKKFYQALGMQPPQPMQPSGEQEKNPEQMIALTPVILRPMINSIFRLKDTVGHSLFLNIMVAIKTSEECRKSYEKIIGDKDVGVIFMSEGDSEYYGFKMRSRPTSEQKARVLRVAEQALTPQRNGEPQLDYSDYMYVEERIDSSANISDLRNWLAYRIKKNREEAAQRAQQAQEIDAQKAQQLEQMRIQKERESKQFDAQLEMEKAQAQSQNEMMFKRLENNQAMKKLITEKYMEYQQTPIENG